MLCKKPYMLGVLPCGCGQCLPCRINRRRLWTHRMMLESVKHVSSSFVTLTYNDATLPSGLTLVPKDLQDWLKRLRRELSPQQIRYYAVGEYGDESGRPHYHAAIFGLDPIIGGGSDGRGGIVQSTWGKGYTFTGDLSAQSASYICGYVTKKMTKKDDPRLKGRFPEFARMSNGGRLKTGGIGASAMVDVALSLEKNDQTCNYMLMNADVPFVLNHGRKTMPLGRYLRSILRENLGYGRKGTEESLQRFAAKMRLMFEDERYAAKIEKRPEKNIVDMHMGKILSLEARYKIFNKRGEL